MLQRAMTLTKCSSSSLRVVILSLFVLALAIVTFIAHTRIPDGIPIVAHRNTEYGILLPDPGYTEENVAVDDPMTMQAVEALRDSFNIQRRVSCSCAAQYDKPGVIQFAKRSITRNGSVIFTFEVVFGNDSVFARISTRSERTDLDGGQKFQVVSSVPGPCEIEPQQQLAISSRGAPRLITPQCFTVLTFSVRSGTEHKQAESYLDCQTQDPVRGAQGTRLFSRIHPLARGREARRLA
jgi:hypothetical protein